MSAPMTIDKLIEDLRAATMGFDWADLPDDACIPAVPLLRKAADALASSQEEIERLRTELAEFDETNRMMVKHADIRKAEIERLRKALEAASLGLDDLMRTLYSPELYRPEHVAESHDRIARVGAPLAYVADLQEQTARALASRPTPELGGGR